MGYNILNILQDSFIKKLYTPNKFIENTLSKYGRSHDLFNEYEFLIINQGVVGPIIYECFQKYRARSSIHDVVLQFFL